MANSDRKLTVFFLDFILRHLKFENAARGHKIFLNYSGRKNVPPQ